MSTHLDSVRHLEDEFAEAMRHMYDVGNDLARLRARIELEESASARATDEQGRAPDDAKPVSARPVTGTPTDELPPPPGPSAARTPAPPDRTSPALAWWQREGTVARALAVAGAAVTLIGVVLLVTLAAQLGLLGPATRVAGGAAIAVALVVVGHLVHRAAGRAGSDGREARAMAIGAVALAATGYAAAYLDVMAVTVVYGWLPDVAGLLLAAVVAATGIVLARRWDSQLLALVTVLGVLGLGPVLGEGALAAAFMLVMTVASQPAQIGKTWPLLHPARTVPTALVLLGGAWASDELAAYTALAVVLALFDLGTTLLATRHRAGSVTAPLVMVTTAPAMVLATDHARWTEAGILGGLAAAHLAAAALTGRPVGRRAWGEDGGLRAVTVGTGSLLALLAVVVASGPAHSTTGLLLLALASTAASVRLGEPTQRLAALALSAIASAAYLEIVDALLTRSTATVTLTVTDLIDSALVVALVGTAVAGHVIGRLPGTWRSVALALAWVMALLGSSGATVTLGVLAGQHLDAAEAGYLAGQAAATVLWLGAAAYLLLHGLRGAEDSTLAVRTGLVLAAIGVGKLLLFDLAALDGIIRAVAFLVAGGLLLAMGTRYATALERARRPAG